MAKIGDRTVTTMSNVMPSLGRTMLQGKELLDKARSLSNCSEDEIARGCGYVSPGGRLLKKSFYRALVEAKGYRLGGAAASTGVSKGRQAEFRTRVHGNGNLLIGHAYTRRMGLEPGQEFHIQIHHETGSIWLLPVDANSGSGEPEKGGGDSDAAPTSSPPTSPQS
jgi:AbrB-like transcriptional regulator